MFIVCLHSLRTLEFRFESTIVMAEAALKLFEKHKKELDAFENWIQSQPRLPQNIGDDFEQDKCKLFDTNS